MRPVLGLAAVALPLGLVGTLLAAQTAADSASVTAFWEVAFRMWSDNR